jgi:uncharacterized protein YutE (UPF0331/DUF86 family)
MIDRYFIETKLSYIQSYCVELDNILAFTDIEIKRDFIKLRALERILQLIVDEIIDINNHIIRYHPLTVPEDFQSSFRVLAEHKILPEEFADKIAPVVGLRNRLVHRYEKINLDLLLQAIRKNKEDFKEYTRYIFDFINN